MYSPKELLDEMVSSAISAGGRLSDLKVPTEFYRLLVIECAPKKVEECYAFPITVDPDLDSVLDVDDTEGASIDYEVKLIH